MKCALLALLLAIPLLPAFARGNEAVMDEVLFDGFDDISEIKWKLRDVVELNRNPPFDNAPFLRLRPNDKLVKAKEDIPAKGKWAALRDKVYVYLFSKGKYYRLPAEEENGKLLLSSTLSAGDFSLLFDWEATRANAGTLRQLLPREYAESLTREQYLAILTAVRKDFPETEISTADLKPDRMISISNQVLFEFHGLTYDSSRNCLYQYTVKIGPAVFSIVGRPLLKGPHHVERWEFEGLNDSGINGAFLQVDPATAKVKKAEYDRMMKFQNLVEAAIESARR